MTDDDEGGVWWWLEVGWHGRRSLVVERRKGDETPSSHDQRHLGTIGSLGRWKKKEINAACCRGHGDLRMETGLRRASGGVMGSWRRAMGCIGAVGRGEGARQKEMVYWQAGKVFSHPPIRIRSPFVAANIWQGWRCWSEDGSNMGVSSWICPSTQPGDRPCPGRPFRGHDPKRCGRK